MAAPRGRHGGDGDERPFGAVRPFDAVLKGSVRRGIPFDSHFAQAEIRHRKTDRRVRRTGFGNGRGAGIAHQVVGPVPIAAGIVPLLVDHALDFPVLDHRGDHFMHHVPGMARQGVEGRFGAAGMPHAPHHPPGVAVNQPDGRADDRIGTAAVGHRAVLVHRAQNDTVGAQHAAGFDGRGFRQTGEREFGFPQHAVDLSAFHQGVAAGAEHFRDEDVRDGGPDQVGRGFERQHSHLGDGGSHGRNIDIGICFGAGKILRVLRGRRRNAQASRDGRRQPHVSGPTVPALPPTRHHIQPPDK